MKTSLLAFAAISSIASSAIAKGKVDPKLPKEIQPLYCMVGEWKSQNAVAVLEGKKHKVDFTVSCAPTAGGMALLCTAKFDIEGLGYEKVRVLPAEQLMFQEGLVVFDCGG